MLYKFKSKAAGDVIMLEANGRQVLDIIGKSAGPQGIITTQQIPAALSALEAAISKDEAAGQSAPADDPAGQEDKAHAVESVSLRNRAMPFIDLLKRSQAEGKDVVWGAEAP